MKSFVNFITDTKFITGAFLGFVFTTLAFTCILTNLYTPNNLLEMHGFYRDGKLYRVIESSQYKQLKRRCVQ